MNWAELKPGDVLLSPEDAPEDRSLALLVLRNDGQRITWLSLEDGQVKEGGAYRPEEWISPDLTLALARREGG